MFAWSICAVQSIRAHLKTFLLDFVAGYWLSTRKFVKEGMENILCKTPAEDPANAKNQISVYDGISEFRLARNTGAG
jgi:hypothetical protein